MRPASRRRLSMTTAIVWAILTISLASWWLVFGLQQANALDALGGPHAARLGHVQRMLSWEGAVLIGLIVVGAFAMLIAARREQVRQQAVEAFFMTFTHELKTALASLQLQAESLREDLPEAASNPNLDRLMKDALRLQLQLENSLYFAQPDGRLLIEALDVAHEVERAAVDWPDLAIRVDGDARVLADARALQSVLRNVLQNAVVHGEATAVAVSVTAQPGRRVAITIADNGRGAPAAAIAALGEPFSPPIAISSGTGVGLYVSRRLVARMRGLLGWRVPQTGGFAVVVELPEAA